MSACCDGHGGVLYGVILMCDIAQYIAVQSSQERPTGLCDTSC